MRARAGFLNRIKVLWLLCMLTACAAVLPALCIAQSADAPELSVALTAEPDHLAAPGEIELSFSLENRSDEYLENVSLTSADGLASVNIGALEPDGEARHSMTHAVTQSELNAGEIHYVATCESGSERYSYPVQTHIGKDITEPEVQLLRRISGEAFEEGQTVTVIYEISNTGDAAAHALELTDAFGSFSAGLDTLEPGETQRFVNRFSPAHSAVSEPTLAYAAGSELENHYVVRLDALAVELAQGMLHAELSANHSVFDTDTAEVFLLLTNGGNLDYTDVTVYDDVYGGVIADSLYIPAGGEAECSHIYPLRGEEHFRWRIMGKTSAGGRIDLLTETLSLEQDPAASTAHLTLQAATSMSRINRKGYVPFTLTLFNDGGEAATRVQILEAAQGRIRELAVVPADEPTVFEVRFPVYGDTDFSFSAVYTDSSGVHHTITTDPIRVTISAGGERPEPFEESDGLFSGISVQVGNSPLFMVMMIGSCTVLVVLTIILLVTSRRARKARRERAAAHRKRMKEELGKTNRFTPVKRASGKK